MEYIIIVGKTSKDAELRFLSNGTAICNLNVATSYPKKIDGKTEFKTKWFKVTIWGDKAEKVGSEVKKGMLVTVTGTLKCDDYGNPPIWQDSKGNPRSSFEINAKSVNYDRKGIVQKPKEDVPFEEDFSFEDL